MALSSPTGGSPPSIVLHPEGSPSPIFVRTFAWALFFLALFSQSAAQSANLSEAFSMPAVSVQGSILILTFTIPRKPIGRFLHLSLDRTRLLGRTIRPGRSLVLCIGHLPPGSHRVGFELAGKNQIVHTDEVGIPVNIPGGSPFSCPSPGKGS